MTEIEGVKIVAILDAQTCAGCREHDGRVFTANDGPLPRFHDEEAESHCRCTIVPVLINSDGSVFDDPRRRMNRCILGPVKTWAEWRAEHESDSN